MPKLTVDGYGTFEVPENKRMVNALTDEAGVDQLHTCIANLLEDANCCKAKGYAIS